MKELLKENSQDFISEPYYNIYGGAYVPEELQKQLNRLSENIEKLVVNSDFNKQLAYYQKNYIGRPSPLYFAEGMSQKFGFKLYLKREDLNHTGSHKINNAVGQILIAKHMGAREIIAETGAGQHGVATATAAAMFGIKCKVFMGEKDIQRQALNVKRMEMLGAEVVSTDNGRGTLKDAVDAALGYYIEHSDSYYLLGSQVGPHPYPRMVALFQRVIGQEAREQILEQYGKLPDAAIACIGGGSNAIGLFQGFINDRSVELLGAEGGGEGVLGQTAATLNFGRPSVFQGTYSYCLLDDKNEPMASYSIAAGLDYPGISPQHSMLKDSGRAKYFVIKDIEALDGFNQLSRTEGIVPALESSHAVALAIKKFRDSGKTVLVNLSGRGDKDVERISQLM